MFEIGLTNNDEYIVKIRDKEITPGEAVLALKI